MLDLTFGEQVKIILRRKGMTIKELAEMMEKHTGKKMSRQNLTQRLGRDNFQEQDMRQIAEILGCRFQLSITEISNSADKNFKEEPEQNIEIENVNDFGTEATVGEFVDNYGVAEEVAEEAVEEPTYEAEAPAYEEVAEPTYEAEAPAYEEAAEPVYEEEPVYETEEVAEPAYEEAPVYEEEPAYEEAPVYEEEVSYEEAPVYEEEPAYEEAPVYEEEVAYEAEPVYETEPVYEEAPAQGDSVADAIKEMEMLEQENKAYTEERKSKKKSWKDRFFSRKQEEPVQAAAPVQPEPVVEEPAYEEKYAEEQYAEEPVYEEQYEEPVYEEQYAEEPVYEEQYEEHVGDLNPYTGREYETNSVRIHPKRIGYVQVYDREKHAWADMTEWAFLGYQEEKKRLLGRDYEEPIYLD